MFDFIESRRGAVQRVPAPSIPFLPAVLLLTALALAASTPRALAAAPVITAPVRLAVRLAGDPRYPVPQGGWAYLFDGNSAAGSQAASLDGTWNRQNGLDSWDGRGRGAGNGLPGGIDTTNGILTIEDA